MTVLKFDTGHQTGVLFVDESDGTVDMSGVEVVGIRDDRDQGFDEHEEKSKN